MVRATTRTVVLRAQPLLPITLLLLQVMTIMTITAMILNCFTNTYTTIIMTMITKSHRAAIAFCSRQSVIKCACHMISFISVVFQNIFAYMLENIRFPKTHHVHTTHMILSLPIRMILLHTIMSQ